VLALAWAPVEPEPVDPEEEPATVPQLQPAAVSKTAANPCQDRWRLRVR
jgi:hypothetical protein